MILCKVYHFILPDWRVHKILYIALLDRKLLVLHLNLLSMTAISTKLHDSCKCCVAAKSKSLCYQPSSNDLSSKSTHAPVSLGTKPKQLFCSYVSTMLCRFGPNQKQPVQERRGSLFEKLRQRGVTEDVALRRQDIYNRLIAAFSVCDGDDCDW